MNKLIAATAVAASVAVGGLAVAAIGPVDPVAARAESTAEPSPRDAHRARPVLRGVATTSAEAIGIPTRELVAAYRGGQSIAEVAADHGVEVQSVEDALAAKAADAIDAAVARGDLDPDRAARLEERLPAAIDRVVTHHRADRPRTAWRS